MESQTVIRLIGGIEQDIPTFFEELWEALATEENEVPHGLYLRKGDAARKFYLEAGTTGIEAFISITTSTTYRRIIIEHDDEDAFWHKITLTHDSQDGKYAILLPLKPRTYLGLRD